MTLDIISRGINKNNFGDIGNHGAFWLYRRIGINRRTDGGGNIFHDFGVLYADGMGGKIQEDGGGKFLEKEVAKNLSFLLVGINSQFDFSVKFWVLRQAEDKLADKDLGRVDQRGNFRAGCKHVYGGK